MQQDCTFNVEVEMSGRTMTCEMSGTSVGEIAERVAERFGILLGELQEISMRSPVISIRLESQE